MTLREPMELPIFFISDAQKQLKDLGLEVDDDNNLEYRYMTIYDINYVMEYLPLLNGRVATTINSGGYDFVVPYSKEELNEIIKKHR